MKPLRGGEVGCVLKPFGVYLGVRDVMILAVHRMLIAQIHMQPGLCPAALVQ